MSCVVVVLSVVSGLATAAMAWFSWQLYRNTEQFHKWTVSQHEPIPVVAGGKVIYVIQQGRKFEFTLDISNPGDGSLVLLGIRISRWGTTSFSDISIHKLTRIVRPHDLESLALTLPLTDLPDDADLTEILTPEKRAELEVTVIFLSGTGGVQTTSTQLYAHWYELPFGGLADGVALLWPAMST